MHRPSGIQGHQSGLGTARAAAVLSSMLLAAVLTACGDGTDQGTRPIEQEETLATTETVPEAVRAKASEIGALLGPGLHCDRWFWDGEDSAWECTLLGHSRAAELDITREADFDELELVVTYAEIERFAPLMAEMILSTCGGSEQMVAEISLRSEDLITPKPDFEDLWTEPDVFLEVQCPTGEDFEIDPFGSLITTPDDDVEPDPAVP